MSRKTRVKIIAIFIAAVFLGTSFLMLFLYAIN